MKEWHIVLKAKWRGRTSLVTYAYNREEAEERTARQAKKYGYEVATIVGPIIK